MASHKKLCISYVLVNNRISFHYLRYLRFARFSGRLTNQKCPAHIWMRAHSSDTPGLGSLARRSPNTECQHRYSVTGKLLQNGSVQWDQLSPGKNTKHSKIMKELHTHFKTFDCGLLCCDTVQSHRQITVYRRNVLLSPSGVICVLDCTVSQPRIPQFEQSQL